MPSDLAGILRWTAMNFVSSSQRLHDSLTDDGFAVELNPLAVPLYYLATHAAELYLKAALLKNGAIEGNVKHHNISRLVEELKDKGATFSKPTITVLSDLAEQHKRHLLRYNSTNPNDVVFTPNVEAVFLMLQELQMLSGRRTRLRRRPVRRTRSGIPRLRA